MTNSVIKICNFVQYFLREGEYVDCDQFSLLLFSLFMVGGGVQREIVPNSLYPLFFFMASLSTPEPRLRSKSLRSVTQKWSFWGQKRFWGLKKFFWAPQNTKKMIFSKKLNSVILPNIGGGSHNCPGHPGTIRPLDTIYYLDVAQCGTLLLFSCGLV